MNGRIVFNGVEYRSVAEMPPDARAAYEQAVNLLADRDANGMPDLVEQLGRGRDARTLTASQVTVNGQTYSNLDEMPADVRKLYDAMMANRPSGSDSFEATTTRSLVIDTGAAPGRRARLRISGKGADSANNSAGSNSTLLLLVGAAFGAALMLLVFWLMR